MHSGTDPFVFLYMRKRTLGEFIYEARKVHGDKYDYSRVVYESSVKKVCIICPEHGEFWMTPNAHLRGHRCPKCFGTPKKTKEQFVEEAKKYMVINMTIVKSYMEGLM